MVKLRFIFRKVICDSNVTSFFRFVNKRAICRWYNLISTCDWLSRRKWLSSARIGQHKLCATLSANVNINYRLPIKAYYRICTLWHIRIEINHGSHTNIRQPMLKLKTHSGFHDLFLNCLRYSCLSPVNNFSAIWWLPYLLWEENQDRHYEITYETTHWLGVWKP